MISMAILHDTQLDDTLQAIPHTILHYKPRNQNSFINIQSTA